MGLSDSFNPAFSNRVRQFQPGLASVVYQAQKDANERYLTGMDKMYAAEAATQATQVTEQDQQVFDQINNDVQGRVKDWTQRGDLENLVPEIYRYSSQLTNKLKYLQDQKTTQAKFEQDLNDPKKGLTPDVIEYYKSKANQGYKGVSFDKFGRPTGRFTAPETYSQIDVPDKIRKAVSIIHPDADMTTLKQDSLTGEWSIQTGKGLETISPSKLLNTVRAARERDSDWQNSNNQEIEARAFHRTKNITDQTAIEFLNSADTPSDYRAKAQAYIQQGYSASKAIQMVEKESAKTQIEQAEEQYALGASYVNKKDTKDVGPSTGATMREHAALQEQLAINSEERAAKRESLKAQAEADAQAKPWMAAPDLVPTVNEETDYETVEKDVEAKQARRLELQQDIATKEAKLAKESDPRIKASLRSEIEALQGEDVQLTQATTSYLSRMGYVQGKAASNLNLNLDASKKEEQDRVSTMLTNKGLPESQVAQIAQAASEGRIKKVTPRGAASTSGMSLGGGADYYMIEPNGKLTKLPKLNEGIFTDTYGSLFRPSDNLKKVQKETSRNWKAFNKDYSIGVPDILPDPGDKQGKAFITGLESMVNGQARSNIRFRVRGKDHDVDPDKIPEDAKFEIAGVAPIGDGAESRVRVKVLVPKEKGEGYTTTGEYYDAYVPINMHEKLGEIYKGTSNPGVSSMVEAFKPNSSYRKITSMPNNSVIFANEDSQFVIQDGVYKLIDKDGKTLKGTKEAYETKDAFKAAEWLNALNQLKNK